VTAPKKDDADEFWASVERTAASVRDLPSWMKVGVVVDRESLEGGSLSRPASAEASSLRKPKLDERFAQYHAANPHVYAELVRLAREAKAAGRTKVGAKELTEVCRWHLRLKTVGAEFRLDNSLVALYARLIQEQEPDLRGLFELRRRRST
jgi:hypothetical protein